VPYQDYSWMAYLAHAGFDVFSMDMTGYGRSTRPAAMNDPCNLSAGQQALFVPALIPKACDASYPHQMTTLPSDWHDIDAVVDHVRALRHVEKLNLLAWSLGGPRSGGYAAQHADKVAKLVLLAPAYNRAASADAPAQVPANGAAYNTQSRDEFIANWDRQVGCSDQYDAPTRDSVWSEMLASDPVGATWGGGVRRAPQVTSWGWTTAAVSKTQIPALMVSGAHDKQVNPDRVRELYNDFGSAKKVFVDLACSSHNAMWEKNHLLLFKASLEWLTQGTVQGKQEGMLRLGY
jgi:pimeloyl-ACP methyl ester carboxylesterase